MRTPEEIKAEFAARGLFISEWARRRDFSVSLVYQVLSGKQKALRGQSHRIAVALGLKEGVAGEYNDLPFEVDRHSKTESEGMKT